MPTILIPSITYEHLSIITYSVILCIILIVPIITASASLQINDIKKNWNNIKCNPDSVMYYPIASDNISGDMTYCVQQVMFSSMGDFLKPLTGMFSELTEFGSGISSQLQGVRNIIYVIRTKIMGYVEMFFGYVIKLMLIFYKFQIQIRTILARFVAIILAMVYVMLGTMDLTGSIWNGVPGKLIQALGSKKKGGCFEGNTKIKLKNGDIKCISNINIGDILEPDNLVESTMKILNTCNEPYYTLPGGVNDELIYVTGTHYVYNPEFKGYTIVELHNKSTKTNIIESDFYCLITSDNTIKIGNNTFWDWEDFKINKLAV
jgi:hypothetical protein